MVSQFCRIAFKNRSRNRSARRRGRRGAVALEFAILAIPFFTWILFIFEMSYDLFTQEALDYTVHAAVRQIQTGSAQSLANGKEFIQQAICGSSKGLLECDHIWLKISAITGTNPTYAPPVTNGDVPHNGHKLDLSEYTNLYGANAGKKSPVTPYCIAGSQQPVLVSVVYLGPSFIGGLLPGVLSAKYGGATVHPTLSTAGFVTEPFDSTQTQSSASKGATTAPPC
jgi:hypothetical protein